MAADSEIGRPNIRIEIKNTSEQMDIDENDRSEEEGEIRDNFRNLNNSNDLQTGNENLMNLKDICKKDIDILKNLDQKKLQERAKRFALKPEEISTFTEYNLQLLYRSLGITSTNVDQVRFEAIHIRGSKELSIRNVILYFMEYAPTTVERVDDESYNIVWEDKLSTARALFHISQVVSDMPVRVASEHVIDNFILEETDNITEKNVLHKNRQIELRDDSFEECDKLVLEDSVDISVINIPIPPGYWRLGKKPINSSSLLMRFSLKIDKKPYQVEKCNKYYKNVALMRGNDTQYKGIFSRNKDIIKEGHDKDPWGILAKNWDEDLGFREREHYTHIESDENISNPVPVNPEMRIRLAAKRRLGKKQNQEESITVSTSDKEQSESELEAERKSTKMPRMRMYADEEEEKIKRKKLLLTLKKQTEKLKKTEIPNSDLRNILRITNKNPKVNPQHDDDVDLSVNLKNRGRKLVFTVSQEGSRSRTEKRLMKDRLDGPRAVSPEDRKPISPIRFRRNNSPEEKWPRQHHRERKRLRSPIQRRESRRSSERFGGRMYSSKRNENYLVQKPKSKVALVIKTQKKPSVASAIQSRNRKFDLSTSSEDSSSEESSSNSSEEGTEDSNSSTSEDSESDTSVEQKHRSHTKLSKVPLKVEIKNDQYKRK